MISCVAGRGAGSLSVCSLCDGSAVALCVETEILVAIRDGAEEEAVVVLCGGQIVRGMSFLRAPDERLCLVSGGDGKFIAVQDVSSARRANAHSLQLGNATVDNATLLFRSRPHTKRITHVAVCDGATVLFADKFGEVFRLQLVWTTGTGLALASDEVVHAFLLQHFSVLSTFFVSSAIPWIGCGNKGPTPDLFPRRRLFTCDRDCHARVSLYPETFRIEQYLWTGAPQSVVTAIAEIQCQVEERRYSHFAVGNRNGWVHLWTADNATGAVGDASTTPFVPSGSFIEEDARTSGAGAVLSVVHASVHAGEVHGRGEVALSQGILVAYEGVRDVLFVPLEEDGTGGKLSLSGCCALRVGLESPPLAMVGLGGDRAMVLQRSGRVQVVRLAYAESCVSARVCEESWLRGLSNLTQRQLGALLGSTDPFSQWNYDTVDPRTRRRGRSDFSEGGDVDTEDGDAVDCPVDAMKKTRT